MTPAQQRVRVALETLGAPAPWRASEQEAGEVVDANGRPVLVVDPNGDLGTSEASLAIVARIAHYVALAVSGSAGEA